ncbi:MAG: hypothetical protein DHS20C15_25730 [Planctomycetota bacterium]|nr:MAG: hypothetical protein DHS20C15_25730 [Planctomycetota bacterium]
MPPTSVLIACVWIAASLCASCASERVESPSGNSVVARAQVALADSHARAPFGEYEVAYSDSGGADTALVFVHGWAADRRVWDEQLAPLAEHSRVLAVDLLGHGLSDQPEIDYSVEVLAQSLQAVLRHAGLRRVVLVGHSNGSAVVLALARSTPQSVAGLIIVDGALQPLQVDPATLDAYLARYRGDDYLTHVERDGRQMLSPRLPPARRDDLLAMMRAVPQHVLVSSLAGNFDPAAWSTAPLDCALLVIRARSLFWTDESQRFAESLTPHTEYHVLDGVTHYLMLDEAHTFRLLLNDFVERRELLGVVRNG